MSVQKGFALTSGVILALVVFFVVLPIGGCVACVMCGGVLKGIDEAKGHATSTAVAATTVPTPPAETAEPPETASNIVSVAIFDAKAQLAACVDADASDGGAPWTPADRRAALAALRTDGGTAKAFLEGPLRGGSATVIDDACSTVFADRLELARCAMRGGRVVMRYYSFGMLENDVEMRDCLGALHGNWSALSRTSDEYRQAHARWEMERAQRQLQGLTGQ